MSSHRYAARLAGFMFLFLIATNLVSAMLLIGVGAPNEIPDTLRNISENSLSARVSILLQIVSSISTFVLASMLYAITKYQDSNLAILALSCRASEAALYSVGIFTTLALLAMSQGYPSASANELASTHALGDLVVNVWSMSTNIGAIFFAVGSTVYSYLFFRARSIPALLSLVGLVASLTLVVGVPIQTAAGQSTIAGISAIIWVPMFIFEISTGLWLLTKGAKLPEEARGEQTVAPA